MSDDGAGGKCATVQLSCTVNGEAWTMQPAATVSDVLQLLVGGADPYRRGFAAALNGEVVPRSQWASTALHDGDRIEVLTVAQGG